MNATQAKTPDPYGCDTQYSKSKLLTHAAVIGISLFSIQAQALSNWSDTRKDADFVCENGKTYNLVWDGWEAKLNLYPGGSGELIAPDGTIFSVRHKIGLNPQDDVEGKQGPGYRKYIIEPTSYRHRIVFWVDFTPVDPDNPSQRFDGYLTDSFYPWDNNSSHPRFFDIERAGDPRHQLIGITWWRRIPFAFFSRSKWEPNLGCL